MKLSSLNRGLVAHCPLDKESLQSATTFADKTPYENVGTKYGSVLKFDGGNDYVSVSDSASLQITGDITVSGWAKSDVNNVYQAIIGKAFASTGKGYMIRKIDTDKFTFTVGEGGAWKGVGSDIAYEDTNWHHIVGILNSGTMTLYVDGILQVDTDTATIVDSGNDCLIGRSYPDVDNYYFSGNIGDTRIYSKALTPAEVLTMYQGGVVDDTGLEAHWKFGNRSGTALLDETANNNDGTLTNFANTTAEYGNTHDTGWNTDETPNVFALDKEDQSNEALSFNGVSDYVWLGNAGSENFTEMTISAWFKPSSFTPDGWRVMLHRDDGGSVGTSMFFIGMESWTNQITGTIGSNAVGVTYLSGKTGVNAQLDTWYHVVSSWNGTTVRTYVDSVDKVSYALSSADYATANKPATTRIGSSANESGYLFAGDIADVRIYNRALNTTEIKQLYNQYNSVVII